MAARLKLDTNARRALIGLGLLASVPVVLGLRNYVSLLSPAELVAESGGAADDQIIVLGGETMFLPAGTVGNKIGSWLKRETSGANAFFVEDEIFVAGSHILRPEAEARLDRLVAALGADGDLQARLFVTDYEGADDGRKDGLASRRAQHLRDEMIARGVPRDQVTTATTPLSARAAAGNGARPTVVIVLSRGKQQGIPDRQAGR